jgi:hypothetical protein
MKGIKFTLYYSVWVGSDYSEWKEVDDYFKFNDRLKVSKIRDIMSGHNFTRFKLVISVQQTDYTDLVLYEHEVTFDYIAQLSMCKKPFELLGILIEE